MKIIQWDTKDAEINHGSSCCHVVHELRRLSWGAVMGCSDERLDPNVTPPRGTPRFITYTISWKQCCGPASLDLWPDSIHRSLLKITRLSYYSILLSDGVMVDNQFHDHSLQVVWWLQWLRCSVTLWTVITVPCWPSLIGTLRLNCSTESWVTYLLICLLIVCANH